MLNSRTRFLFRAIPFILLIVLIATHSGSARIPRFSIEEIKYYPEEIEGSLGRVIKNMLFTRLSRKLDGVESEERVKVFLEVTKIGSGYSFDGYFLVKEERKYFSFSVKDEGEIPSALERISDAAGGFTVGKVEVSAANAEGREGREEELRKMRIPYARYLPQGRTILSGHGRGSYELFAGGEMNLDGGEEIVGGDDTGVDVWSVGEEGSEKVFTVSLPEGANLKNIACADLDRDMKEEALVTFTVGSGWRWILLDFDSEKRTYRTYRGDGKVSVYDHPKTGMVAWEEPGEGNRIVFFTMKEGEKEVVDVVETPREFLQDDEMLISPLWDDGMIRIVSVRSHSIWLDNSRDTSVLFPGEATKLFASDIDGDGTQEVVVFGTKTARGTFLESLPVTKGAVLRVYSIKGGELEEVYRYENDEVVPGGFYLQFDTDRKTRYFAILAREGSEFSRESMSWRRIYVR